MEGGSRDRPAFSPIYYYSPFHSVHSTFIATSPGESFSSTSEFPPLRFSPFSIIGVRFHRRHNLQDPYGKLQSWSEDDNDPCTNWVGVKCDPNAHRVTQLTLDGFSLSGHIGRGLLRLSYLQTLSLSNNNFFGPINPDLTHLGGLQVIDFTGNSLSGSIPDEVRDPEPISLWVRDPEPIPLWVHDPEPIQLRVRNPDPALGFGFATQNRWWREEKRRRVSVGLLSSGESFLQRWSEFMGWGKEEDEMMWH